MTPTEQADYRARRGTAEDIINLVNIYSQLDTQAKGELLTAAVELLAAQRVRGQKRPDGEPYEVDDWLKNLAKDTYPSDDTAAQLLQMAIDYGEHESIFSDGELSVVLTSSEDEASQGASLYECYLGVRNHSAACPDIPSAEFHFFGVGESDRNYETYEYPETEEEWKAGIRDQCVAKFTGFMSLWRTKFYGALLSKA